MKNKTTNILIILTILLVTMVAFIGVYWKEKGTINNQVKEYKYGIDIEGKQRIFLELDESKKDIIKDAQGKIIESATDEEIQKNGYTKEQQPVNSTESLTEANYNQVKQTIEKRLQKLGVKDFAVRLDEGTGKIVVELPNDDTTNNLLESLTTVGKLEIVDTQTKEVLLSNKQIKASEVYRNSTQQGIAIAFSIEFNDEGTKKLEEITKTYVKTKSEEDNTTTQENTDSESTANQDKTVTLRIDDSDVFSTAFETPITDGVLSLSSGQTSTDTEQITQNLTQARTMSAIFANEPLALKYQQKGKNYVQEQTKDVIEERFVSCVAAILIISGIVFIIRFKKIGLFATAANIGLSSLLLLIVRYWNVELTMEGLVAIIIVTILNTILTNKILWKLQEQKNSKEEPKTTINKELKQFLNVTMPIFTASVLFSFVRISSTSSFGMVMFWGLLLAQIYNIVITKNLLKNVGGNINEQK